MKSKKNLYKNQGKKFECFIVDDDLDTVKAIVQSLLAAQSEHGYIRNCCYCKKVFISGVWTGVGELMKNRFIDKITDTICPECKEKEINR